MKKNNTTKHDHDEHNHEQISIIKIGLATLFLIIGFLIPNSAGIKVSFYLLSYLLVGVNVLKEALEKVLEKELFDENFLMTLATIGALATGEYLEAILVMLLYQIGELLQSYAVGKSRKSIKDLMDIRPDYANIEIDGKIKKINPVKVKVGDIIIVQAGEKVPLDGKVIEGGASINTASLTGESKPITVRKNDSVLSGSTNQNGLLKIEVTKTFQESTATKILKLIEEAESKKATTESFITKFAHYYTPIVVFLALILAFIPPLLINKITLAESINRALTFLVISCPCALVISIPLGFFGGIGRASKQGILVKGSNYLEALSKTDTILFDKTGTLTKGGFEVIKIKPIDITEEKLLEYASYSENYSNHPIAKSIKEKYKKKIKKDRIQDFQELSGYGISVKVDKEEILVGNEKLMKQNRIKITKEKEIGTIIYIAINHKYSGYIVIADQEKEEAKETILSLKEKENIKRIIMLTGDNKEIAKKTAENLQIDEFYAELLPVDKVKIQEKIIKEKKSNKTTIFVGDGLNDAPVLIHADVGIAMGALATDATIEASDIVIMDDDLSKIGTAIQISKKTIHIVKQNISFAILVKVFFLFLATFGITNMLVAVFSDVGVSIIAIINSMRILNIKQTAIKKITSF